MSCYQLFIGGTYTFSKLQCSFGEGKGEMTLEEINLNCREKYPNFKEIIYYLDETWKEKLKKYIAGEINDKDVIC